MADGDIKISFSFPLSAAGGQVTLGDAITGSIALPGATGTVS